jgi:hypothetical protein
VFRKYQAIEVVITKLILPGKGFFCLIQPQNIEVLMALSDSAVKSGIEIPNDEVSDTTGDDKKTESRSTKKI